MVPALWRAEWQLPLRVEMWIYYIMRLSNPTSGHTLQRTESRVSSRYLYTQVHKAVLFNTAKGRSNSKCSSVDE